MRRISQRRSTIVQGDGIYDALKDAYNRVSSKVKDAADPVRAILTGQRANAPPASRAVLAKYGSLSHHAAVRVPPAHPVHDPQDL